MTPTSHDPHIHGTITPHSSRTLQALEEQKPSSTTPVMESCRSPGAVIRGSSLPGSGKSIDQQSCTSCSPDDGMAPLSAVKTDAREVTNCIEHSTLSPRARLGSRGARVEPHGAHSAAAWDFGGLKCSHTHEIQGYFNFLTQGTPLAAPSQLCIKSKLIPNPQILYISKKKKLGNGSGNYHSSTFIPSHMFVNRGCLVSLTKVISCLLARHIDR